MEGRDNTQDSHSCFHETHCSFGMERSTDCSLGMDCKKRSNLPASAKRQEVAGEEKKEKSRRIEFAEPYLTLRFTFC